MAERSRAQRSQENPVAKQCREPGGKGVPDFIVKHIKKYQKKYKKISYQKISKEISKNIKKYQGCNPHILYSKFYGST